MNDDFVSVKNLADELGMDPSHMRRYVLKNGLEPHKRRTPESRGQPTLALTPEEAEYIRAKRRSEGYLATTRLVAREVGSFYVIRLVPELDPRRLKLGFAENVASRLAEHRTAAPTAALVANWPCKRSWETTAIDCLASVGCRLILNEVYECDDVDALIVRGDRFFSLLPDPEMRPGLSDHSPYNT